MAVLRSEQLAQPPAVTSAYAATTCTAVAVLATLRMGLRAAHGPHQVGPFRDVQVERADPCEVVEDVGARAADLGCLPASRLDPGCLGEQEFPPCRHSLGGQAQGCDARVVQL
jgi:hypothetical protein